MFVTQDVQGPTIKEIRPARQPQLPVYQDLVAMLAETPVSDQPTPEIRHVMAACSAYAYSDAWTMATTMARLGMEQSHCRMISLSVDGMLLASTVHVIQSIDNRVVIVCYRGPEPLNFISWLASGDAVPETIELGGVGVPVNVHGGFYRNVRSTRFEVVSALERAAQGASVHASENLSGSLLNNRQDLEAIYLTGHGLGGAMAVLMALMLTADVQRATVIGPNLRAVYTFGQPMIGDTTFAEFCDPYLQDRLFRHVYSRDVVPHLPRAVSGPFVHGREREYQYYRDGRLHDLLAFCDRSIAKATAAAGSPLPAVSELASGTLREAGRVSSLAQGAAAGTLSAAIGTAAAAAGTASAVAGSVSAAPNAASAVVGTASAVAGTALRSANAVVQAAKGVPAGLLRALDSPPPNLLGAVRDLWRGGRELPAADHGEWVLNETPAQQVPFALGVALAPAGLLTEKDVRARRPSFYKLDDHLPEHYVSAARPPQVESEFGDD